MRARAAPGAALWRYIMHTGMPYTAMESRPCPVRANLGIPFSNTTRPEWWLLLMTVFLMPTMLQMMYDKLDCSWLLWCSHSYLTFQLFLAISNFLVSKHFSFLWKSSLHSSILFAFVSVSLPSEKEISLLWFPLCCHCSLTCSCWIHVDASIALQFFRHDRWTWLLIMTTILSFLSYLDLVFDWVILLGFGLWFSHAQFGPIVWSNICHNSLPVYPF